MSLFVQPAAIKDVIRSGSISPGSSKDSLIISRGLVARAPKPPSAFDAPHPSGEPSELRLANLRFQAKILISKLAMHIDPSWRAALFKQLDDLVEVDAWDQDEPLPSLASIETLMRAIIFFRFRKSPGLGIFNGLFLATWTHDDASLTIECQPLDRVRWVLSHLMDGDREAASGSIAMRRLPAVLSPYNVEPWLFAPTR